MSTVYSFSGFAKVLIKNKIMFSIRDFLDPKKVDALIEQLIKKTCDEYTYVGAGIARACFIDGWGECAIKVNKRFYTDYSDEEARYEYDSYYWNEEEMYVDGGWAFNDLNKIIKSTWSCCEQNYSEISTYEKMLEQKSSFLDYVPKIYAVSSNWQVEIVEYCESYSYDKDDVDTVRRKFINDNFDDAHDGNLGYNRQGKLIILDFGI